MAYLSAALLVALVLFVVRRRRRRALESSSTPLVALLPGEASWAHDPLTGRRDRASF